MTRCSSWRTSAAAADPSAWGGAGDLFADFGGPGVLDADTQPWSTLPGVERIAVANLAGSPAARVLFIGTAVDGQWTSWYPPVPAPPVPVLAAGR